MSLRSLKIFNGRILTPYRVLSPGSLLIRDGRITEGQLQESLTQQGREGGRIGTILVELQLIEQTRFAV